MNREKRDSVKSEKNRCLKECVDHFFVSVEIRGGKMHAGPRNFRRRFFEIEKVVFRYDDFLGSFAIYTRGPLLCFELGPELAGGGVEPTEPPLGEQEAGEQEPMPEVEEEWDSGVFSRLAFVELRMIWIWSVYRFSLAGKLEGFELETDAGDSSPSAFFACCAANFLRLVPTGSTSDRLSFFSSCEANKMTPGKHRLRILTRKK